ncbi:hypothetical protein [Alicyclobacillus sp. ALC3]|uniref:hypothetical protein n=1 Tax=Alicyclobacillus sp. ALC3 TaxID=2796143 RepID=UPI0023796345|nr:hypothetical protein [Alicyclobacillus sp. ALC3]WDL99192.1 hypothetical protein JC200_11425 [Alicyclobacillus sp. ALC3]
MTTGMDSTLDNNEGVQSNPGNSGSTASSSGREQAANLAMSPATAPSPSPVPHTAPDQSDTQTGDSSDMILDFTYKTSMPAGDFLFSDTDVQIHRNQSTRYGIRHQVVVTFHVELPTGTLLVDRKFMASKSSVSQFYRFVVQMLGRAVGKTFDCCELAGMTGMLRIVHNTSDEGDTYANVEQVWNCSRKGTRPLPPDEKLQ